MFTRCPVCSSVLRITLFPEIFVYDVFLKFSYWYQALSFLALCISLAFLSSLVEGSKDEEIISALRTPTAND